MITKYLKGLSIEDWFRLERKNTHGASIVWKGMEKAFPLVGNWTSWKVSNKRMVKIEEDPWIGAKGNYKLSEALLLKLHEVGIFPLWEAASQEQRNAWSQGWLSSRTLNIQGILASGIPLQIF